MNTPYTYWTQEQLEDNVSKKEILKILKKELSQAKADERKWMREVSKEIENTPSYESPRISSNGYSYTITDLQLAIATVTDYDITNSILPQNHGEIIYAINKSPYNIFYVKDMPFNDTNFQYAFSFLPMPDDISYSEKKEFRQELHKAILLKNKNKVEELIDKYSEKLADLINKYNEEENDEIINESIKIEER